MFSDHKSVNNALPWHQVLLPTLQCCVAWCTMHCNNKSYTASSVSAVLACSASLNASLPSIPSPLPACPLAQCARQASSSSLQESTDATRNRACAVMRRLTMLELLHIHQAWCTWWALGGHTNTPQINIPYQSHGANKGIADGHNCFPTVEQTHRNSLLFFQRSNYLRGADQGSRKHLL